MQLFTIFCTFLLSDEKIASLLYGDCIWDHEEDIHFSKNPET